MANRGIKDGEQGAIMDKDESYLNISTKIGGAMFSTAGCKLSTGKLLIVSWG